jgi:hypothetical protein
MSAACPQLRPGLRLVEQVYRGEASVVVKDPGTGKYFRFRPAEAAVVRCLDGTRTPAQVAAALAADGMRVSAAAVETFARRLAAIGLIERSLAERSTLELERLRAERRQRRRKRIFRGELTRIRWSVGDPDALLDRTLPYLRWCFSRTFVVASVVLFAAYFIILAATWDEYARVVAARYSSATFTLGSFALFWVTLTVVSAIHELGHGYACKYFGGEVHEIGVMALYFSPAFYCNVNDAWSFPELRARLWVTAAGGWIQFVVAALASLVWLVAVPGSFLADVTAVTMLVGGALTLLTNANPLLPLDGYFALTDYLEIPNLRLRALEFARWWFKRRVLRLELPEPEVTERERRVFLTYGALATVYVTFMLLFLASVLLGWVREALGAAGVVVLVGWVVVARRRALRRGWQTLAAAARGARRTGHAAAPRRRKLVAAAVVLALAAPWPHTVTGAFTAVPARYQLVTAPTGGAVAEVLGSEGAAVRAGTPLVRLADYRAARALAATGRTVDSLTAEEVRTRARGLASTEVIAAERASGASELAALRGVAFAATVRAGASGVVLTPYPADLLGRRVAAGDALITIGGRDSVELRVSLAGAGATLVRVGQSVRLITDADAAAPVRATIASIALSTAADGARGSVEVRARVPAGGAWRAGVRGEAKATVGRSTVLGALVRAARSHLRGDLLL